MVEGKLIQRQGSDDWEWKGDPTSKYSAHSAYNMLWEETTAGSQEDCFEELWRIKIPSKIAVFAWRLLKDRLPTRLNLQRRQVQITDMSYPFCRSKEEDASHLFIHCNKIQPIWWESMSWLNIKGAFPQTPKHHFLQHTCSGWRHKGQEVAVLVVGCNMVYLATPKQDTVLQCNFQW